MILLGREGKRLTESKSAANGVSKGGVHCSIGLHKSICRRAYVYVQRAWFGTKCIRRRNLLQKIT